MSSCERPVLRFLNITMMFRLVEIQTSDRLTLFSNHSMAMLNLHQIFIVTASLVLVILIY